MKKLLIALLCVPITLFAANWYVRPSATGSGSGADWNNAWSASGISWSKVAAGDTVWLAGGSYGTGLTVSKGGASGSPIKIYRATSNDSAPKAAAGWSSTFDSQIKLNGIAIPSSSYVTVDGRTQYGILITIGLNGGYGIECDASQVSATGLSFYNIDVLGPYGSPSNPARSVVVGWKISPSTGPLSNVLFDHCRVRGVDTGVHCLANNVTVQYCTIQDIAPDNSTDHEDVLYCYPSPNMTWRYNSIINCTADGLFFEYGGAVNFKFYGNLYYSTHNHLIAFKQGASYGPVYIYNNTFHSPSSSSYGFLTATGATIASGSQVYNNIFYNCFNEFVGFPGFSTGYNAYNYTSLGGFSWPSGEPHSFTFSGNPFVSIPPYTDPATIGNFHLAAATAAIFQRGVTLTADGYINKDIDGNIRGSHGVWYVGAYEYSTSSPSPTPTPTPSCNPTPTPTPTGTSSLFSSGAVPSLQNLTDSSQLQLGVKFQASRSGKVTAIRFYKCSNDAGPHAVSLWTAGGGLLASTSSTSETSSGWQQVKLVSPVNISAGTTYVAAYHTSSFYSASPGYFGRSTTSGPLTAPAGSNGVYAYAGSGSFPSSSYNSTNYWVDIVFQ